MATSAKEIGGSASRRFSVATPVTGSARGLAVDALPHGNARQLLVRSLLLVEIGVEEPHHIVAAESFGPRDQGPVARDLIVLDRLRCTNDRRIQNLLVRDLAGDVVGGRR